MAKRRYQHHFTDVDQFEIQSLAALGFSYRGIAEVVSGVPAKSNSDHAKRVRSAISSYLSSIGVKLKDWRDVRSKTAKAVASRALQQKRKGRAA